MLNILEKLGFKKDDDGFIEVPTYRNSDISVQNEPETAADLAEEISRIYGLDNIGHKEPSESFAKRRDGFFKFLSDLHDALTAGGYFETYTFSFVTPKYFDKLNLPENSALRGVITLINPMGEDTSVMRTALLPSMLATMSKNCASRNDRGYFYDVAKTYFPQPSADFQKGAYAAIEKNILSVGFYDTLDKSNDFYTIKGAVENIMQISGIYGYKLSADISSHPLAGAFHPGRSAIIQSGEKIYGIFGEIHPVVSANFEIETKCYAAELDIDLLYADSGTKKTYAPLPKYPATTRDLALVCGEGVESAEIYGIKKKQSGNIFESAEVFDVYKGEKIGEGKKSVAFAISFRSNEYTLEDGEVNTAIKKILDALKKEDITLRN
jgi:phenylalanyl-tRNA synthetase beta chain